MGESIVGRIERDRRGELGSRQALDGNGQWFETEEGTPQGAVISPVLANLYLHHELDLWVNRWRKKEATGDVIIVRYADDAVLGFQYEDEAKRFLEQLRERVGKFGLELH